MSGLVTVKFERSGLLDDALMLGDRDGLLRHLDSSVPKPAAKPIMISVAMMQAAMSNRFGRWRSPLCSSLSSLVKYDGGCDVRAVVEDLGSGISARTFSLWSTASIFPVPCIASCSMPSSGSLDICAPYCFRE